MPAKRSASPRWSTFRRSLRRTSCSVRRSHWKTSYASRRCCAAPILSAATPKSFAGLKSPAWPSHLFPNDKNWTIDEERVKNGRKLYAAICVECHLGPTNDPEFDTQYSDKSFWTAKNWKRDKDGGWVLDEEQRSVKAMGTDPSQGNVLRDRMVEVPGFLNLNPAKDLGERWRCEQLPSATPTYMPFSIALMIVVDRVSQKWLADHNVTDPNQLAEIWGERSNCPNRKQLKEAIYRARPLNGVWATAPYLHNGSVPSLHWMLTPQSERPTRFCMGAREFDPRDVGFRVEGNETSCSHGQTVFSTASRGGKAIKGNSVLGHSFEAAANVDKKDYPDGVIGRLFTPEERLDLIEYLKKL